MSFEDWCKEARPNSTQFHFWDLVLNMELSTFTLVRSFREANVSLYRAALCELLPYFFANNNVNYECWLSIHLQDMTIDEKHPQVAQQFHRGHFVVHKSERELSAIAIDQAHEQNNAVKGDGGAIGLTEDPAALRRWMVAGPEISYIVAKYEAASIRKDATAVTKHHEQGLSAQNSFFGKVDALHRVLQAYGNPFLDESSDLMVLDTKDIADPANARMVIGHHTNGKEQFRTFMEGPKNHDHQHYTK